VSAENFKFLGNGVNILSAVASLTNGASNVSISTANGVPTITRAPYISGPQSFPAQTWTFGAVPIGTALGVPGYIQGTSQTGFVSADNWGLAIDSGNTPASISLGQQDGNNNVTKFFWGSGSKNGIAGDVEIQTINSGTPTSIILSPQGGQNGSFIFGGTGNLTLPGSVSFSASPAGAITGASLISAQQLYATGNTTIAGNLSVLGNTQQLGNLLVRSGLTSPVGTNDTTLSTLNPLLDSTKIPSITIVPDTTNLITGYGNVQYIRVNQGSTLKLNSGEDGFIMTAGNLGYNGFGSVGAIGRYNDRAKTLFQYYDNWNRLQFSGNTGTAAGTISDAGGAAQINGITVYGNSYITGSSFVLPPGAPSPATGSVNINGLTAFANGNVTTGNVTGTYYTAQNNKLAARVRLSTTVLSANVSYVEFNFQPWLSTYRKFVLEFQGVDQLQYGGYNSSGYYNAKYHYLLYSYDTSGSQTFNTNSSPGYFSGLTGTGLVRSAGYTGSTSYTLYTSSTIMYYFASGIGNNTNYIAPYGTIEFPNNYLTGVGGTIRTEINYVNNYNSTNTTDIASENCPATRTIAGIRFYIQGTYSYNNGVNNQMNTGTLILYGVDPI
jgi:hypothetical protein